MAKPHAAILGGLLLALVLFAWPSDAEAAVSARLSVSGGGIQANDYSYYPSVSADGRFVAFQSGADNLVAGDTNGAADIFVHDRQTGVTERVSVASSGTQGDAESNIPWISADGRFVAFQSEAGNLVPGDTNKVTDVFVHDRQTGDTERVSVATGGTQGDTDSYPRGISADGRSVIFTSDATNLVPGDTNQAGDIFVRDRVAGVTERVSLSSAGAQGNGPSWDCALSADGRYAVFQSAATNLVPGDTNGKDDILVRDRVAGTTERVSVATAGTQANDSSYSPHVSADGRYVVFSSDASNLVVGDSSHRRDVLMRDRATGTTKRVSISGTGTEANGASGYPAISADGRYVAFQSYAGNLVSGDSNGFMDVFVHDLLVGTTECVSRSAGGTQGNAGSATHLSISADGRYVAFVSSATNLVSPDANGSVDDVYLAEIAPAGSFADISASRYRAAIEGLAQAGILNGYQDRTFRPANPVLRAQFAKMIVLVAGLTVTEGGAPLPFRDVPAPKNDLYPDDYVATAAANGLVQGYGGGIFGPYTDVTRAQLLTIVVRAAERFKPGAVPVPPAGWSGLLPTSDATHGRNIARAEYAGLLAGVDLNGFAVGGKATRGETAQILWNLRQK